MSPFEPSGTPLEDPTPVRCILGVNEARVGAITHIDRTRKPRPFYVEFWNDDGTELIDASWYSSRDFLTL